MHCYVIFKLLIPLFVNTKFILDLHKTILTSLVAAASISTPPAVDVNAIAASSVPLVFTGMSKHRCCVLLVRQDHDREYLFVYNSSIGIYRLVDTCRYGRHENLFIQTSLKLKTQKPLSFIIVCFRPSFLSQHKGTRAKSR